MSSDNTIFPLKYTLLFIVCCLCYGLQTEAKFIDTTCVSGNCSINLRVNDKDLSINFEREDPLLRLQVNANNVDVEANFSRTFKILAYEQNETGNHVLSVSNVLLPPLVNFVPKLFLKVLYSNEDPLIGQPVYFLLFLCRVHLNRVSSST